MEFPRSLVVLAIFAWFTFSVSAQQTINSPAKIAYTPTTSTCASGPGIRSSAGRTGPILSLGEVVYSTTRRTRILSGAWKQYLATVQRSAATHNITIPPYVSRILSSALTSPTLGIAISGGSYRAALFGAGTLNALDARNASGGQAGVGGLLQSTAYLSGLSGGSWLVTALYQANFPTLPSLVFGLDGGGNPNSYGGFIPQFSLLQPSDDNATNAAFIQGLIEEISGKFAAGFPVTLGDVWTRSLSRHFTNGTNSQNFFSEGVPHGAGETFSGAANIPSFQAFQQPFPIIVANTISPHEDRSTILEGDFVPLTNPIYEINPFEMGSFDPILASFIPTRLLGSQGTTCVTGFDQAAYVAGISSNLWPAFNTTPAGLEASIIGPLIDAVSHAFPRQDVRLDSPIVPNPFKGIAPATFIDTNETFIALTDGGEDGEVIPLQPLLVKSRHVDVIVAIDASADTPDGFADGSSLIATQDRAALFPKDYSFPPVPTSPETFLSQNLTKRPTFFGCNTSPSAPLVIYLANGGAPLGQQAVTNASTFQDTFTSDQMQRILDQTFDVATQGISVGVSKDPQWPVCLACAVVDRARARAGDARSGVCASCLRRYCWS